MFDFLNKIYQLRKQTITLIVWEDEVPDDPKSFRVSPGSILNLLTGLVLCLLIILFLILYYSPVGVLIFGREDSNMRNELTLIGSRLLALQDSLLVRDQQLQSMKHVLFEGLDTTFTVNSFIYADYESNQSVRAQFQDNHIGISVIPTRNMVYDMNTRNRLVFPTSYPITGTLTQGFLPELGHFGVDIATQVGSVFYSVGDGVLISSKWTINDGFVMHIQHNNGYISVYKHCATPYRKEGDIIKRGDILGTISNSGVMSSGPHLHFEIWKDGVPLNPSDYFVTR